MCLTSRIDRVWLCASTASAFSIAAGTATRVPATPATLVRRKSRRLCVVMAATIGRGDDHDATNPQQLGRTDSRAH